MCILTKYTYNYIHNCINISMKHAHAKQDLDKVVSFLSQYHIKSSSVLVIISNVHRKKKQSVCKYTYISLAKNKFTPLSMECKVVMLCKLRNILKQR